jgi:dipeptidyl aminopeptidase/acylaminoacyl peptidase
MLRRPSFLVIAVLLLVAVPRAVEKRFITENDLLKFTWIADPQIAPDGSTIAFVRVTVNEKENRYETSLFTVATAGADAPRRLTSNVRDTMPRWSPDARKIAFARSIEKDGKPQPGRDRRRSVSAARAGGQPDRLVEGGHIADRRFG